MFFLERAHLSETLRGDPADGSSRRLERRRDCRQLRLHLALASLGFLTLAAQPLSQRLHLCAAREGALHRAADGVHRAVCLGLLLHELALLRGGPLLELRHLRLCG